jgi:hypothetical protein
VAARLPALRDHHVDPRFHRTPGVLFEESQVYRISAITSRYATESRQAEVGTP